jgi:CheY-like chemotaxis protein
VEDNTTQNEAIRQLIGNGDVKCFSAYQGGEAYDMLTKDAYDCIIVDLGLPDMSGMDLLEKIKVSDALNKIPVIVYTGMDLSKEVQARLSRLASTVVLKTADSQERLLDEATLFLHREQSRLPQEAQTLIRKLHQPNDLLRNKRILIVDDDMRNIYSLTNALEEEGLHCVTAENGKEALSVLYTDPAIDIVLMDIMMPEMDGYEATLAIRKKENFRKLPIIALTAKAMKGDKEKCLAVGMSDYISKPLDIPQLLNLLKIWLYK